jgi:hypothetical protein
MARIQSKPQTTPLETRGIGIKWKEAWSPIHLGTSDHFQGSGATTTTRDTIWCAGTLFAFRLIRLIGLWTVPPITIHGKRAHLNQPWSKFGTVVRSRHTVLTNTPLQLRILNIYSAFSLICPPLHNILGLKSCSEPQFSPISASWDQVYSHIEAVAATRYVMRRKHLRISSCTFCLNNVPCHLWDAPKYGKKPDAVAISKASEHCPVVGQAAATIYFPVVSSCTPPSFRFVGHKHAGQANPLTKQTSFAHDPVGVSQKIPSTDSRK